MKLQFKIKQVKPRIFLFEFTDKYDLCMHFLRYQEFYESPNPKFRNKSFTIIDYIEWQAKTVGGNNFTYATSWSGFNLPSNIMYNCMERIADHNKYDDAMDFAYGKCISMIDPMATVDEKFYIIGTMKGSTTTLTHEIAHGLFYLNPKYKKEMTKLVNALPVKIHNYMNKMLKDMGYVKQVFIDEIQAYFSTTDKLEEYLNYYCKIKLNKKQSTSLITLQKSFIKVYFKYSA